MKDKLNQITNEEIGAKNDVKNFYPFTTKDDRVIRQFSFDEIIGLLVNHLSSKKMDNFDFNTFKESCLNKFREYIDDEEAVELLENVYFKENTIKINSLFIKQTNLPENKSKKVFEVFKELINSQVLDINFESNLNFLEQIVIDQLKTELKPSNQITNKNSYLPFLEELFVEDLKFLSTNKHYFSKTLESFLELYLFLYCSQLALNLQPVENALSIPKSQELYFILNNEMASKERKKIEEFGYKKLYAKAKYIFPYFSLLSIFSKVFDNDNLRLYELEEIFDENDIQLINTFHKKFRETKKLEEIHLNPSSSKEALISLFDSSFEQFQEGKQVDRKNALDKYTKAFEKQVAKPFLVNRKRAGNVLVLDQDRLILLTNICIGDEEKIRFQELIREFNKRGIYFDTKSQSELINTYEKIGNIERKSDSGDAVYVKKTI